MSTLPGPPPPPPRPHPSHQAHDFPPSASYPPSSAYPSGPASISGSSHASPPLAHSRTSPTGTAGQSPPTTTYTFVKGTASARQANKEAKEARAREVPAQFVYEPSGRGSAGGSTGSSSAVDSMRAGVGVPVGKTLKEMEREREKEGRVGVKNVVVRKGDYNSLTATPYTSTSQHSHSRPSARTPSHASNASAGNGSSTSTGTGMTSKRMPAPERVALLRADVLLREPRGTVEPHRVLCGLCSKWVALRKDTRWCWHPWGVHKGGCLARL